MYKGVKIQSEDEASDGEDGQKKKIGSKSNSSDSADDYFN
jgi:hypothetical protein